jgi:hypothetical protein
MFDQAADTSLRGSFRVSGLPTTGDPQQVCPQTTQRFEDQLMHSALTERRADTTFLNAHEARMEGLSAYLGVADELAARDEPRYRRR